MLNNLLFVLKSKKKTLYKNPECIIPEDNIYDTINTKKGMSLWEATFFFSLV